jgi:dTDP-4-dehydrorhamnose reductase
MKTILVTGSNGLLGQKLVYKLKDNPNFRLIAVARGENRLIVKEGYEYHSVDITDRQAVLSLVKETAPDAIINTAAMTNVDACEDAKEACWDINVNAVGNFIESCNGTEIHLVHLSTDFVFDGENGPYKEGDKPNPLHYYAESKLASEKLLEQSSIRWTVARTIIVYGIVDNMSRSNLVLWSKGALEKGQEISVITDQYRAPTLAEDLADGCIAIVEREAFGLYHLSGPETDSIIDLVYKVADFYDLDKSYIKPVTTDELNQVARRPLKTGFIIDKARIDLDYNPHNFDEGIKILDEQLKSL